MKWAVIIAALLLLANELSAQGFDWQPTLRRPYEAPKMFVGIEAGMGLATHNGTLSYLEKDIADPCCTYSSGSSMPIRIGPLAEYWFASRQSAALRIGLQSQSAEFAAPVLTYPRAVGQPLSTQYILNANLTYLQVSAEFRQRIGSTMLMLMGGIRGNVLVSSAITNREIVVGPPDAAFIDGSREHVLPTTGLDDAAAVVLEPYVSAGYDVPLSMGYYLEPTIQLGYSITSLSNLHPWRMFDVSFGVRLMKGR